jgi:hypothetical protein
MWTSLEALMLSHALDTHMYLDKPKDSEWIHILLAYLKTYVESAGMELLIHEEDKVAYIYQLVDSLKVSADQLDSGTTSRLTRLVAFDDVRHRSGSPRPSRHINQDFK